jgi:hypothetical protein
MADERRAAEKARRIQGGIRGPWAVSPDGKRVAAGTPEGKIEVWAPPEPRPAFVLEGHGDLLQSLAFCGPGTLLSLGPDPRGGTGMREWDLAARKLAADSLNPEHGHGQSREPMLAELTKVVSSPSGRFLGLAPGFLDVLSVRDRETQEWIERIRAMGTLHLRDSAPHVVVSEYRGRIQALDVSARGDADDAALRAAGSRRALHSASAMWVLLADGDACRLTLSRQDMSDSSPRGEARCTLRSVVLDAANLLITHTEFSLEFPFKKVEAAPKPAFAAWDLKTGVKRWERKLVTGSASLLEARDAPHVILLNRSEIVLLSPDTGAPVKSVRIRSANEYPEILAPDGTVGYRADKDGNLICFELSERPKSPEQGTQPPSGTSPAPGSSPEQGTANPDGGASPK